MGNPLDDTCPHARLVSRWSRRCCGSPLLLYLAGRKTRNQPADHGSLRHGFGIFCEECPRRIRHHVLPPENLAYLQNPGLDYCWHRWLVLFNRRSHPVPLQWRNDEQCEDCNHHGNNILVRSHLFVCEWMQLTLFRLIPIASVLSPASLTSEVTLIRNETMW